MYKYSYLKAQFIYLKKIFGYKEYSVTFCTHICLTYFFIFVLILRRRWINLCGQPGWRGALSNPRNEQTTFETYGGRCFGPCPCSIESVTRHAIFLSRSFLSLGRNDVITVGGVFNIVTSLIGTTEHFILKAITEVMSTLSELRDLDLFIREIASDHY